MFQDPNSGGGLLLDPRMMGLLGMASALGQAGAPSRTPVSFASAMGQGMQGGMQGYLQGHQLRSLDDLRKEQIKGLQSKREREAAQRKALDAFYGGRPQGPLSPQDALGQGAAVGDVGPTVTNEQRMAPQNVPGQQPGGVPNFGALLAAGVDPKVVNAMMKEFELKNPNVNYQGGLPLHPRTGQPMSGATTVPQTNQQGFSTLPVIGPDGKISIQVTPGSAEAFKTQQQITQGTQADYDLVNVNMPDGSTQQMPRSQAVRILGPQQGTPPGQTQPWSVGMDPAYAGAVDAVTAGRPQSEIDAIRAVSMADSRGQPMSVIVPSSGRAQPPAQAEAAKVAAAARARADVERETDAPQARFAYETSVDNLDRLAADASSLITHKGTGRITGVVGAFPDIPGSKAADARAKLSVIKSQAFVNAIQAMREASKTGGAVGSVAVQEMRSLENNIAALETAQSEDEFKRELRKLVTNAQGAKERLTRAYQGRFGTQGQPPRSDDVMKAADQILGL